MPEAFRVQRALEPKPANTNPTPPSAVASQPQPRRSINIALSPSSQTHQAVLDVMRHADVAGQAAADLAATRGAQLRQLGPQQRLFAQGDSALSYYLVLSGELIVHTRRGGRPSIRFVGPSDLVMFAQKGRHEVHCDSVVASSVMRLDPCVVDELASANANVKRLIERERAREADLISSAEKSQHSPNSAFSAQQPDFPSR